MPHRNSPTHGLPLRDEATIATLAQETETEVAVVKCLYDEEIALLQAEAKVRNFIGVIAARRVRQRLAAAHAHRRPVSARAA